MPYIKSDYRQKLDNLIVYLIKRLQEIPEEDRAGSLNYTFTRLLHSMCISYDLEHGDPPKWNYRTLNETIGVLNCVQQELYRIVASPYEEQKAKENGQILEFSLLPTVPEVPKT